MNVLNEGKLPDDILKKEILDKIHISDPNVLALPVIGEDCSAIAFGEEACILTTDPITGAMNNTGKLAVHVATNDIASCGAKATGILVTVLAPLNTALPELTHVLNQINDTCKTLKISLLGGHTEVTSAVNRIVVVTTAVGRTNTQKLILTSGAKAGDSLIMTKAAALEGTAILATDQYELLSRTFSKGLLDKAQAFIDEISVIREGVLAASLGAHAMHDVTEGGVLGAAWEMSEAAGLGIVIEQEKIKIRHETNEICKFLHLDPNRLISSGCMIIACDNPDVIISALSDNGIEATNIGYFTADTRKVMITPDGMFDLTPPGTDEIYKI